MALESIQNNSYTNLQSALEAARQRTKISEKVQVESTFSAETPRVPKSTGGSLFERLYGSKVENKPAEPARLGTRFDRYA